MLYVSHQNVRLNEADIGFTRQVLAKQQQQNKNMLQGREERVAENPLK